MDINENKRKKGIETHKRILETAASLFAKEGYDNVPIRKIASVVGIKESSIYNHFDSKSSILNSLFEYFSNILVTSRPTFEELNNMMVYLGAEEILKNVIIRIGKQIDIQDQIATIIYVERFRNKHAAKLYYDLMIEEQREFYTMVFKLMKDKELISLSDDEVYDVATQYNYVLVALSNEYAMSKNGLGEPLVVVKKMFDATSFLIQKLARK